MNKDPYTKEREELIDDICEAFSDEYHEHGECGFDIGCIVHSATLRNEVDLLLDKQQSTFNKRVERVEKLLEGIDKEQTESDDGWWETSIGAKFGKKVLEDIIKALKEDR